MAHGLVLWGLVVLLAAAPVSAGASSEVTVTLYKDASFVIEGSGAPCDYSFNVTGEVTASSIVTSGVLAFPFPSGYGVDLYLSLSRSVERVAGEAYAWLYYPDGNATYLAIDNITAVLSDVYYVNVSGRVFSDNASLVEEYVRFYLSSLASEVESVGGEATSMAVMTEHGVVWFHVAFKVPSNATEVLSAFLVPVNADFSSGYMLSMVKLNGTTKNGMLVLDFTLAVSRVNGTGHRVNITVGDRDVVVEVLPSDFAFTCRDGYTYYKLPRMRFVGTGLNETLDLLALEIADTSPNAMVRLVPGDPTIKFSRSVVSASELADVIVTTAAPQETQHTAAPTPDKERQGPGILVTALVIVAILALAAAGLAVIKK